MRKWEGDREEERGAERSEWGERRVAERRRGCESSEDEGERRTGAKRRDEGEREREKRREGEREEGREKRMSVRVEKRGMGEGGRADQRATKLPQDKAADEDARAEST